MECKAVERSADWIDREYGTEKWPMVLGLIREQRAEGETDLARVLAKVMRKWRKRSVWQAGESVLAGHTLEMPYGLAWEAKQGMIVEGVLEACRPDTTRIIELGSGWGFNLMQAWTRGGPRSARYIAAEYTQAGRDCAAALAELAPEMEFEAHALDYHRIEDCTIAPAQGHTLVFTAQSIEQIPHLSAEVLRFIGQLGDHVTCVHFEPVGWQLTADDKDAQRASRDSYSKANDYNQNLWALLQEAEANSELRVQRVVRDLVGPNPKNPVTLFEWNTDQDEHPLE